MNLRGRVALVTGGAVRIGAAISRGLSSEGMRLIVHYHSSADEADALVGELRRGGGEAVAIRADLTRHAEVERLAREAEAAFSGIDVLVNSASVFPEPRFEDTDEALWDQTLALDLKAPFFLTRALAPGMRGRGGAVVVNIADLSALQTWTGYAAHAIAKAGLVHFTRIAARSLAPDVRVVAVVPGTVLPPESMPADELRALVDRTPLKRIGSPDDVVRSILFLLHSEFATGETLVIDGGRMVAG